MSAQVALVLWAGMGNPRNDWQNAASRFRVTVRCVRRKLEKEGLRLRVLEGRTAIVTDTGAWRAATARMAWPLRQRRALLPADARTEPLLWKQLAEPQRKRLGEAVAQLAVQGVCRLSGNGTANGLAARSRCDPKKERACVFVNTETRMVNAKHTYSVPGRSAVLGLTRLVAFAGVAVRTIVDLGRITVPGQAVALNASGLTFDKDLAMTRPRIVGRRGMVGGYRWPAAVRG